MADAVAAQLRAVALPPSKSPAARKAVAALQRACEALAAECQSWLRESPLLCLPADLLQAVLEHCNADTLENLGGTCKFLAGRNSSSPVRQAVEAGVDLFSKRLGLHAPKKCSVAHRLRWFEDAIKHSSVWAEDISTWLNSYSPDQPSSPPTFYIYRLRLDEEAAKYEAAVIRNGIRTNQLHGGFFTASGGLPGTIHNCRMVLFYMYSRVMDSSCHTGWTEDTTDLVVELMDSVEYPSADDVDDDNETTPMDLLSPCERLVMETARPNSNYGPNGWNKLRLLHSMLRIRRATCGDRDLRTLRDVARLAFYYAEDCSYYTTQKVCFYEYYTTQKVCFCADHERCPSSSCIRERLLREAAAGLHDTLGATHLETLECRVELGRFLSTDRSGNTALDEAVSVLQDAYETLLGLPEDSALSYSALSFKVYRNITGRALGELLSLEWPDDEPDEARVRAERHQRAMPLLREALEWMRPGPPPTVYDYETSYDPDIIELLLRLSDLLIECGTGSTLEEAGTLLEEARIRTSGDVDCEWSEAREVARLLQALSEKQRQLPVLPP